MRNIIESESEERKKEILEEGRVLDEKYKEKIGDILELRSKAYDTMKAIIQNGVQRMAKQLWQTLVDRKIPGSDARTMVVSYFIEFSTEKNIIRRIPVEGKNESKSHAGQIRNRIGDSERDLKGTVHSIADNWGIGKTKTSDSVTSESESESEPALKVILRHDGMTANEIRNIWGRNKDAELACNRTNGKVLRVEMVGATSASTTS
jgi:hypothetical protein